MGEKYLRIDFNQGEQWKVNLKTVATLIANKEFDGKVKGNLDAYFKRIDDLIEDEMELLQYAWDIPWSVLKEYAVRIGSINVEKEWASGAATTSVVE